MNLTHGIRNNRGDALAEEVERRARDRAMRQDRYPQRVENESEADSVIDSMLARLDITGPPEGSAAQREECDVADNADGPASATQDGNTQQSSNIAATELNNERGSGLQEELVDSNTPSLTSNSTAASSPERDTVTFTLDRKFFEVPAA